MTNPVRMDPFQITVSIVASIYVVCNCCLQIGTNRRLDDLRDDGKYIGKHLRDIIEQLDQLPKKHPRTDAVQPNLFTGTRIEDALD